jgi:hypothetical protein
MPRTLRPVTPLARLILESGRTLYVTAAEAGINYSRMSDYANGRMAISSLHRAKLAEYFRADPTSGERQTSGDDDDHLSEGEPVVFWASLGALRAQPARAPVATLLVPTEDMPEAWRLLDAGGGSMRVWMAMDGDDRMTRRPPELPEGLWWHRCAEVKVLNLDASDSADGPLLRLRLRVNQSDRDTAFEYLAPGGVSAPRPRTLFRQALFAFTLGDDPPPVRWIPVAEADELDSEAATDIEALVDEGSQAAVGTMIEILTYGTLRDKMRAAAFFRRFLDVHLPHEADRDGATAQFEQLVTELRSVQPSANGSAGAPAQAAQPGLARDQWATRGVEGAEELVVASGGP